MSTVLEEKAFVVANRPVVVYPPDRMEKEIRLFQGWAERNGFEWAKDESFTVCSGAGTGCNTATQNGDSSGPEGDDRED